jgi:hypothetical protein
MVFATNSANAPRQAALNTGAAAQANTVKKNISKRC